MALVKRVVIVLAQWCPHCVPFSLQNAQKMADELGVPLTVLDIDIPEQLEEADRLVEAHGDWCEDYLIPQVFIEYADGKIEHILTGFSESVTVTEARWKSLFSSSYYKNLLSGQKAENSGQLKTFVENHLSFEGKCSRHCDKPTSLIILKHAENSVVGAYVCPRNYVSRVVCFSANLDVNWFRSFLASQIGGKVVRDSDLRVAARHGWELGNGAADEIGEISSSGMVSEVYWAMHPQTEAEKSLGIFQCSDSNGRGCGKLFIQDIKSREKLCPTCR